MKKAILFYLILSTFSISWSQEYKRMMNDKNYNIKQIQKEAEKHFLNSGKGEESGYK